MHVRRPSLWLLALAVAIALPACAAPVLPLPPPTALVEGPPDVDGNVQVSGVARRGAYVACLNLATDEGVLVRADLMTGDYTVTIAAMSNDELVLWQYEGSDAGGMQARVVVPEP